MLVYIYILGRRTFDKFISLFSVSKDDVVLLSIRLHSMTWCDIWNGSLFYDSQIYLTQTSLHIFAHSAFSFHKYPEEIIISLLLLLSDLWVLVCVSVM